MSDFKPAKRSQVPLIVGITGSSFSGKTVSALRLATGMQRVYGGEIGMDDTESRRGELRRGISREIRRQERVAPPFRGLRSVGIAGGCARRGPKKSYHSAGCGGRTGRG